MRIVVGREMWSPDEKPNLTWSHPWASSPAFLVMWYLFGVRPTGPGWSTMAVTPAVGDLESGRMTMPTVRGPVEANFTQELSKSFALDVRVPAGVRFQVNLPLPILVEAGDARVMAVAARGEGGVVVARQTTQAERGYAALGEFRGDGGRWVFSVAVAGAGVE